MDELERILVGVMAAILSVVTGTVVVLWGKTGPRATFVREWIGNAAKSQFDRPCLIFRLSIGIMTVGSLFVASHRFTDMDLQEWPRMLVFGGLLGTIFAAFIHPIIRSIRKTNQLAVPEPDAERSIPQPGIGPVVTFDSAAEFVHADDRIVFTGGQ